MALTLDQVRKQYPQYHDLSDAQLADGLHQKYYADIPKAKFYQDIGYAPAQPAPTPGLLDRAESAIKSVYDDVTGAFAGDPQSKMTLSDLITGRAGAQQDQNQAGAGNGGADTGQSPAPALAAGVSASATPATPAAPTQKPTDLYAGQPLAPFASPDKQPTFPATPEPKKPKPYDWLSKGGAASAAALPLEGFAKTAIAAPVQFVGEGMAHLYNAIPDAVPYLGRDVPADQWPLKKLGDWLSDVAEVEGVPDNARQSLPGQIASGIGQVGAFMTPSAVIKGGTMLADSVPVLMGMALGGQQGGEDYSQTQKRRHKDENNTERGQVFLGNSVVGMSDALPIFGALGKAGFRVPAVKKAIEAITEAGGDGLLGHILNRAARGTAGTLEEGGQELFQQGGQNLIANGLVGYDPDRKTWEGAPSAGAAGGVIGFLMNAALPGRARTFQKDADAGLRRAFSGENIDEKQARALHQRGLVERNADGHIDLSDAGRKRAQELFDQDHSKAPSKASANAVPTQGKAPAAKNAPPTPAGIDAAITKTLRGEPPTDAEKQTLIDAGMVIPKRDGGFTILPRMRRRAVAIMNNPKATAGADAYDPAAELKKSLDADVASRNVAPWQIPRADFYQDPAHSGIDHEAAVEAALERGDDVSPAVLVDYPDLIEHRGAQQEEAARAASADGAADTPKATTAGVPVMITRAMRAQLRDQGYSADAIRGMTPQQAHDAINAQPKNQTQPKEQAADSQKQTGKDGVAGERPIKKPSPTARVVPVPNSRRQVTTAGGHKVHVAGAFVDADDLITSHTTQGNPNPSFPAALQPRDRSRISSTAQIGTIAHNLDPELLDDTAKASDGAPIVGDDGVVESGNGRVTAIRTAYRTGKAEHYRDFVARKAAAAGVDISGLNNPVYVRRRTTPLDEPARAEFTRAANQSDLSGLSPAETARSDAARLSADDLADFAPDASGNVLAASNTGFLRQFAHHIGADEAAALRTSDGRWNKRMADRVQAAVFAKAYADDRLLSLAAEEADPEIKNVLAGLQAAAPAFARARTAEAGFAEHDTVAPLIDAIEIVRESRRRGQDLGEMLRQADAFTKTPDEVADIARTIDANIRSGKRLGEYFKAIGDLTEKYARQGSGALFGDSVSTSDILRAARDAIGAGDGQTQNGPARGRSPPTDTSPDRAPDARAGAGPSQSTGRGRAEDGRAQDAQSVAEPTPGYGRVVGKLIRFVGRARQIADRKISFNLGKVKPEQAARIKADTGLDVSNYSRVWDNYGIRHALASHGGAGEALRGQRPLSDDDFALALDAIARPDSIALLDKRNKNNNQVIEYRRRLADGRVIYLEEARTGSKRLALASLRIENAGTFDALREESPNFNALDDAGQTNNTSTQDGNQSARLDSKSNNNIAERGRGDQHSLDLLSSDPYGDLFSQQPSRQDHDLATDPRRRGTNQAGASRGRQGELFATRAGTSEAQKDAGRGAFRDLARRVFGASDRRRSASVLGLRLLSHYRAGQPNRLIGQTARTPGDLAALAQIYRDPRFETLRVVFMQGDTVVAESAYTSRMAAAVNFSADVFDQIAADQARHGADGYYLLHNHPSGTPAPSMADEHFTRRMTEAAPDLRAHVVVDHNAYAVIDRSGVSRVEALDTPNQAPTAGQVGASKAAKSFLGQSMRTPERVAAMAKAIEADPDQVVIVTTNAHSEVQGLFSVPVAWVSDKKLPKNRRGAAELARVTRETGSGGHRFLIVGEAVDAAHVAGIRKHAAAGRLNGVYTDVLLPGEGSLAAKGVVLPSGTRDNNRGRTYRLAEPSHYNPTGDLFAGADDLFAGDQAPRRQPSAQDAAYGEIDESEAHKQHWRDVAIGREQPTEREQRLIDRVREARDAGVQGFSQMVEYIDSAYPGFLPANRDNGVDGGANQSEVNRAWQVTQRDNEADAQRRAADEMPGLKPGLKLGTLRLADGQRVRGATVVSLKGTDYRISGTYGRDNGTATIGAYSLNRALREANDGQLPASVTQTNRAAGGTTDATATLAAADRPENFNLAPPTRTDEAAEAEAEGAFNADQGDIFGGQTQAGQAASQATREQRTDNAPAPNTGGGLFATRQRESEQSQLQAQADRDGVVLTPAEARRQRSITSRKRQALRRGDGDAVDSLEEQQAELDAQITDRARRERAQGKNPTRPATADEQAVRPATPRAAQSIASILANAGTNTLPPASRVTARKGSDGRFRLVFSGTTNEVAPGETFKSAPAARRWYKALHAKAAEQPAGGSPAGQSPEGYGENIQGVRTRRADRVPGIDWNADEIERATLSTIWPKSQIEAIDDDRMAAALYAIRDAIPAKPRKPVERRRWAATVREALDRADRVVGQDSDQAIAILRAPQPGRRAHNDLADKASVLAHLDRSLWSRIKRVRNYPNAYRFGDNGQQVSAPHVEVTLAKGIPVRVAGPMDAKAVAAKVSARLSDSSRAKTGPSFEIRGRPGRYAINKKGDREYRKLMTFDSVEAARKALAEDRETLMARWNEVKARDNVGKRDIRKAENMPRTGADYRHGQDATDALFQQTFGFRAINFGRWVGKTGERQQVLNDTYDGLMDLAGLLNIDPAAISLNGSLGVTFGKEGTGWASAHYDPQAIAINLTKTRGAGSLAHEWFHALDNYFAAARGGGESFTAGDRTLSRSADFITDRPEPMVVHRTNRHMPRLTQAELDRRYAQGGAANKKLYDPTDWQRDPDHPAGVRPEVERAFAHLVATLNASEFTARSARNDKGNKRGYWGSTIERAARAFEAYTIRKMENAGYQDDFLANVIDHETFAKHKDPNRYPYPYGDEMAAIGEAFDRLFNTIESAETEHGVALFSRPDAGDIGLDEAQRQTEQVRADHAQALRAHRENGTPLPAPNGRPSNLTEHQWVHTRTPNFKRWFGDWLGKARLVALRAMAPVEITQDARADLNDKAAGNAMRAVYRRFQQLSVDQSPITKDGHRVRFSATGIKKTKRHGADRRVLQVIPQLPELIEKATPLWSETPRETVPGNVRAFHNYGVKAQFPDGKQAYVRLLLREQADGTFYYDNDATAIEDIEKALGHAPSVSSGSQSRGDLTAPRPENRLVNWATRVNAAKVSQVVDENGEPLVVYHGTPSSFDAFSDEKKGSRTKSVDAKNGFFFTDNPSIAAEFSKASSHGSNTMPVFLNLRDPAISGAEINPLGLRDFNELLGESKTGRGGRKDGAVAFMSALEHQGRIFVAYSPNQIKSAIGNRGTYDPADDRINYARAYHGSPHTFDRFSLEAMGTGEGVQAYGWGLYFASKRKIAEFYRDTLPNKSRALYRGKNPLAMSRDEVAALPRVRQKALLRLTEDATIDQAIENAQAEGLDDVAADIRKMLADGDIKQRLPGNLYQVDVPEADELLDYDAPLSQQPKKVKAALDAADLNADPVISAWKNNGEWSHVSGQALYRQLVREAEYQYVHPHAAGALKAAGNAVNHGDVTFNPSAAASHYLNSLGIPGLRYRDAGSRDGAGDSHNYVIWDENKVSVEAVNDEARQAEAALSRPTEPSSDADGQARVAAIESELAGPLKIARRHISIEVSPHPPETIFGADARGVEGAYDRANGRILIFGRNIATPERAAQVLRHEAVGHFSMEQMLGAAFKPMLADVHRLIKSNGEVAALAERVKQRYPGLDPAGDTFAKEVVAAMAEARVDLPVMRRIMAAIQRFLRRIGLSKRDLSADELHALINRAERELRGPGGRVLSIRPEPFTASEPVPTFYSGLAEVLAHKLPGKGQPAQFKQAIEAFAKKGQIKAEELAWSGIGDWLDEQAGTVTRAEVLDALAARTPQIEETVRKIGFQNGVVKAPKYSEWRLPGGDDYRELLIRLPEANRMRPEQNHRLSELQQREEGGEPLTPEEDRERSRLNAQVRKWATGSPGENFRSSHFNEPNILAHLRMNTRTDADGATTLFIEEIQSDWHQDGRKKGYTNSAMSEEQAMAWQDDIFARYEAGQITRAQRNEELSQLSDAREGRHGVPDAPFKKTWPLLAIKRAIRYAADTGHTRIAWTTGAQQAARYDLSKHIDAIRYRDRGNGQYDLDFIKNGATLDSRYGVTQDALHSVIGKEAADKIVNRDDPEDRVGRLEGVDLAVGGEGMVSFYDAILPATVNKYVKKFGAKTGEATIDTPGDAAGETQRVHAIDVTPAMREAAAAGQPLFSRSAMKSVDANIERGRKAMNRALVDKTTVHRAMYRPDLGWIDFEWGDEGGKITPTGKRKGEKGIAHILEARQRKNGLSRNQVVRFLTNVIPDVIAQGRPSRPTTHMGVSQQAVVEHNGQEVILVKRKGSNAWLLTGYEKKPDAARTGNVVTDPTQPGSTTARTGLGAGNNTIARAARDDNDPLFSRPDAGAADNAPGKDTPAKTRAKTADNTAAAGPSAPRRGPRATVDRSDVRLLGHDANGQLRAAAKVENGAWVIVTRTPDMFGYGIKKATTRAAAEAFMRAHGLDVSLDAPPPATPPGQGELPSGGVELPESGYFGNVAHWLQYKAQDKFEGLTRLRRAAEATRGEAVSDAANVRQNETLYHGRTRARMDAFDEHSVDPLLTALQKTGFRLRGLGDYIPDLDADLADRFGHLSAFDAYLYARHAPEANARLAEINPGEHALSGMSDDDAARIMAALTAKGEGQALAAAAARVDAMVAATRDLLADAGLETRALMDQWAATYQHYVPLKGESLDQWSKGPSDKTIPAAPRTGRGFNVRGPTSQRRLGRASPAQNILSNVVAGHYATINRAEKNGVGRSMLRFALENPSSLYEVDQPMIRRTIDPLTGLVTTAGDPAAADAEHVFSVRVDGIQHRIVFDKHNVEAMRLARSLKNMGATEMGVILKGLHGINRYLSLVSTSLNPEFMLPNFARDLQTAAINLNDTEADGLKYKIVRDALKGKAYRAIRRHQKGRRDSAWSRYYDEFRADGGETGWLEGYNSLDGLNAKLTAKLDRDQPGSIAFAKRSLGNIGELVSNVNGAVENSIRLSAYIHAREAGVSRPKAARLAKELTVDFNRKGEAGNALNAAWLFYNASIQGSARIAVAAARSPKARRYMAAAVGLGITQYLANYMFAGDDDDGRNQYDAIPDYIKQHNWIVMADAPDWMPHYFTGPSGDYLKFPQPYGYNAFAYLGQKIGRAMLAAGGFIPDYHPADEAIQTLTTAANAFNPLGGDGDLLQTVAPTVLDPAIQWVENKNFAGIPIHPEASPFGVPPPNYTLYFNSARTASRAIAKELNMVSGGSAVTPGGINVSPELLDFMFDQATGGAGRFVADTADAPLKLTRVIAGKEKLDAYQIPFVGKVYGTQRSGKSRELYYQRAHDLIYLKQEYEHARETGDGARIRSLRATRADETAMLGLYRNIDKRLAHLRRAEARIKTAKGVPDAVKSKRVDAIRDAEQKLYHVFNQRYRQVVLGQKPTARAAN